MYIADKIIVYSQQIGGKRIPVTVRIEWLADGKINPLMYWMPDGSCYQVSKIYERTPIAFLKDCGVGIRFKVRGLLAEASEVYSDHCFAQQDTYLYFADTQFHGKNFIDQRYKHAGKEYIPVVLDVFPSGDYELLYFWAKGERYKVEKKLKIEPRGCYSAGGVGHMRPVKESHGKKNPAYQYAYVLKEQQLKTARLNH
jgi:hypothetical protein